MEEVNKADTIFLCVPTPFDKEKQITTLKLNPKLSPVKAAVFPIIKKPEYEEIAQEILANLRTEFNCNYDKSGSIGRRYARNDEIGTPFCITIDFDTLGETPEHKNTVTMRDRDTGEQERLSVADAIQKVVGSVQ